LADALVEALATAMENLLTRDYLDAKLAKLRAKLRSEIQRIRTEIHDIKADMSK